MSDDSRDESGFIPEFPALSQCVICDARHQSRLEIAKKLKASDLFETTQEAKSISNALTVLEFGGVDACIIGPSTTFEAAESFIDEGMKLSQAEDCAFLGVVDGSEEEIAEKTKRFYAAGVHGVIRKDCSKREFFDALVLAVVQANAGSPWVGVILTTQYGADLLGDSFEMLKQKHLTIKATEIKQKRLIAQQKKEEGANYALITNLFVNTAPDLKRVGELIRSGEITLDEDGKPSEDAVRIIDELVDDILVTNDQSEQMQEFNKFFRDSLFGWVVDSVKDSPKEALEKFRRKLMTYQP